jgi:hypothetical protein
VGQDVEITANAKLGSKLESPVPKDPKFENPTWQANFRKVLPKMVDNLCKVDPVLGPKCVKTLKELAEAPNLDKRMDTYTNVDDYLSDRILDIAWP